MRGPAPGVFLARAYLRRIGGDLRRGGGVRALPPFAVPIDYTRFREFAFAYEEVRRAFTGSARRLLDVGSPKLFPLSLASTLRELQVTSLDIVEEEAAWLAARKRSAAALEAVRGDTRSLPFPDASFDLVTSISAIEHVAPQHGGDEAAIREIGRVLRSGGRLVATVPFAPEAFTESKAGDVYERAAPSGQAIFFQRFYDEAGIQRVFGGSSGLELTRFAVIHERFRGRNPARRWANLFGATPARSRVLSPLYPILGHLLLSSPRALDRGGGRPYLACVVCRKGGAE